MDIIIIYENLIGNISIINLIKNIKKINEKINIFYILKNKDEKIENEIKNLEIENIFYLNQINEIINLLKKDNNENSQINKIDTNININEQESYIENNLIIILGDNNSGKTMFLNNFEIINNSKNNYTFKEINIDRIDEIKNINNFKFFKIIFIMEINLEKIMINKKIINKLIYEYKINKNNIYIIFNKCDKYSINKKIAKKLFYKIKIIGKIKFNNFNNYLFNIENNYKKENKKLKNKYLKIKKRLEE